MGLATIDPRTHKVQTKLRKIPKFGVNRLNMKQDILIQLFKNVKIYNNISL